MACLDGVNLMFNDFFESDSFDSNDTYSILSVSDLTKCIRMTLEADGMFTDLWVKGEVSNLTRHPSGHIYFSLKDESALIRCVIWAGTARYIKQNIQNGSSLIVHGRLTIYDKQGQYQFNVDRLMEQGIGGLYEAYEKLKERLRVEGMFDPSHKISIPRYPEVVAMITSPTGAVVRDMVSIARRRLPFVNLVLVPTLVQGEAAPSSIVNSIKLADEYSGADVIILARGGGSLEDIWCFNDEAVVRAIYECETPIVSAVGHETDTTLSDYAADLRAPTPSAAIELVLPDRQELLARVEKMHNAIISSVNSTIEWEISRLKSILSSPSLRFPERMIETRWQTLDLLQERMGNSYNKLIMNADSKLSRLTGRLDSLSPLNVLSRGYSIVRDINGKMINSILDINPGDITNTIVSDGTITSKVTELKKGWDPDNGK